MKNIILPDLTVLFDAHLRKFFSYLSLNPFMQEKNCVWVKVLRTLPDTSLREYYWKLQFFTPLLRRPTGYGSHVKFGKFFVWPQFVIPEKFWELLPCKGSPNTADFPEIRCCYLKSTWKPRSTCTIKSVHIIRLSKPLETWNLQKYCQPHRLLRRFSRLSEALFVTALVAF